MAMRPGRFYAALFVLTFSTLALEIVQTRLLSVVTWYHLAFFVISSAMFGMTAGAVWIYLRRDRFTQATMSGDLTMLAAAFAVTTALSLAFQVTLAPTLVPSVSTAVVFLELALALAIPFFFSGAAVSLALTRSPFPIGRVYAVDLAGAALGCLGALALLELTDAPSAILWTAAGSAAAATLFQGSGIGERAPARRGHAAWLARPGLLLAVLLAAALANGATSHGLQPILVKNKIEGRGRSILFERWNTFSRISAAPPFVGAPGLWGRSSALPADVQAEQIYMRIDGEAGTGMHRFDGDFGRVHYLAYDVTNLAYYVRRSGRAAVIGVGGGRDVLSALSFGFRDVTGVEINPIFIDLLVRREPFTSFAGLASRDDVRLVVDEARSWMTRTRNRFDLIQMSMIDTWAATGAGAFTLTENGLYTLEAWTMMLDRLTPEGVFTVSRWYAPSELSETGRMVSLATASLLESGIEEPRRHLFLASSGRVATLLLARSPLPSGQLDTLRRVCRDLGYEVLVDPETRSSSALLEGMLSARSRPELERVALSSGLDLKPPTDERPFFFNLLPLDRPLLVLRYLDREVGVVRGNLTATLTLGLILVISILLVAATIVFPLAPAAREAGRRTVLGGTAFFALLGLGFMLAEMGLLQRLSVFLGHPVYSLSVVLFSLILTTGAGSFVSDRFPLKRLGRFLPWALAIGLYLVSLPLWLPVTLAAFQTSETPMRILLCTAVIAPGGFLMGFGFPTGMRLAQAADPRPTPWFWGINGAAGVLASVLAVTLSIALGIGWTVTLAGLAYWATIPAALVLGFPART